METVTQTLTDFLLARIAEDEGVANATRDAVDPLDWTPGRGLSGPVDGPSGCASVVIDPARVLADCEAKRRIIGRHQLREFARPGGTDPLCAHCRDHWPCGDLRDLAAVYADHPDYDEAWRP